MKWPRLDRTPDEMVTVEVDGEIVDGSAWSRIYYRAREIRLILRACGDYEWHSRCTHTVSPASAHELRLIPREARNQHPSSLGRLPSMSPEPELEEELQSPLQVSTRVKLRRGLAVITLQDTEPGVGRTPSPVEVRLLTVAKLDSHS